MKYRVLEGVTKADVAYKVYGRSLNELFTNAAVALTETMVDTSTVSPLKNFKFQISNFKLNELLLDFLNELVFLKDARRVLFSRFDVQIKKPDAKRYTLNAKLWGDTINPAKQRLKTDVKAVTRHKFSLKKKERQFIATVVLDI